MSRPSHIRSVFLAAVIGLVSAPLLGAVHATTARAAQYSATLAGKCCDGETIEAGATEKEYFVLTNTGTETWGAVGIPSINLGTDKPRGRTSTYFQAPDWPIVGGTARPSVGVAHEVPSNASYKFAFDVKAPVITAPKEYIEHFGLLAEAAPPIWIDQEAGLGPDLYLHFKVVPAQPPSIVIGLSASTVVQGGSFSVNAAASDGVSVNHAVIEFAGQQASSGPTRNAEITADEQTTWNANATFTTSGVESGPRTVIATAYDDAGLSTTVTATVNVQSPPPPPQAVAPVRMGYAWSTAPRNSRAMRLKKVVITGTQKGERVYVACHFCHGVRQLGPTVARGGEVAFRPRHLIVTRRSKLIVYVVQPGLYGRYRVYGIKLRASSAIPRQQGCLTPGVTTHAPCPR
ncbi:MAG TPA: hypothetical protein VFY36_04520 [Solirubrobacteraceae bacterium]|nr:hypothetical protein [Solirubrobacteraceae bacterium]